MQNPDQIEIPERVERLHELGLASQAELVESIIAEHCRRWNAEHQRWRRITGVQIEPRPGAGLLVGLEARSFISGERWRAQAIIELWAEPLADQIPLWFRQLIGSLIGSLERGMTGRSKHEAVRLEPER